MSSSGFAKVTAARAAEICSFTKFRDRKLRDYRGELSPREFFELLVRSTKRTDAMRFLAAALPIRDAIWWYSLCLWRRYRNDVPPEVDRVLEIVLRWIREPDEFHRRAAEEIGRELGLKSPAGVLAMTVFWSGNNMARMGMPAIRPPEHLASRVAGAGIVLTSTQKLMAKDRHRLRHEFIALGREVAQGALPWLPEPQEAVSVCLGVPPVVEHAAEAPQFATPDAGPFAFSTWTDGLADRSRPSDAETERDPVETSSIVITTESGEPSLGS